MQNWVRALGSALGVSFVCALGCQGRDFLPPPSALDGGRGDGAVAEVDAGDGLDGGADVDGGSGTIDGGAIDPGDETIVLTVRTTGGDAVVNVTSRDGSVRRTCTDDCEVSAPLASGGFTVAVRATGRGVVFRRFTGCTAGDPATECTVGPRDTTVDVVLSETGLPTTTAQVTSNGRGDDFLRGFGVDAAGNRYFLATLADAMLGGESRYGTTLFSTDAAGALRFARVLSSGRDLTALAVHPTTGDVWVAGRCSGSERFDDAGTTRLSGACAARYASSGTPLGYRVWEGASWISDIAIGADGTVAVFGGLSSGTASWDGHTVRSADGNQIVARVEPSPMALAWVRSVAHGATDLGHGLAVGPDGSIYPMGCVRGPHTVGGVSIDIASFQFSGYLVRYSRAGALLGALRLGSTDVSNVNAVVADATGVYVAGTYSGQLDIGNATSRDARGLSSYPYVARLGADLRYAWHMDGELWQDHTSLASRPGGGVLVSSTISDVFSWEEGATGDVVSADGGAVVSALDAEGNVDFMSLVGSDVSALVASAGTHAGVGGSVQSTLVVAPTSAAVTWDVYAVGLGE